MAADPDLTGALATKRLPDIERALRDAARERGLDYVCLYRMSPTIERVFGARFGPRITIPEPELPSLQAALNEGGLVTGGAAPRQVSGVAVFGSDYLILAGYQLDPEISGEIEALQKNLTMYRRLGVYTWLSQRSLWIFAGLWSLALGLLSFLLAALVSRGISRPVVALESAMERVSAGDLSRRVKPQGTREVRFLGTAFNRMVDEIQTSRLALLRAERLAAWREVARAVAHEIRNPLTPIQFALQRLKEEARRPGAPRAQVVEESAEAILREVRSLQEFATAFSSVAQLPEPNPQRCDLVALAEDVARLYSTSTPVEFRVEAEPPVPVAWADPGQIQRVLVNLIKNALEAMDGDGLDRAARAAGGADRPAWGPEWWRWRSRTRSGHGRRHPGPGDPSRLHDEVDRKRVGLTLVQRIVEQHGGRLALESSAGVGTRAVVTIPVAPRDRREPVTAAKIRILVVDDEPSVLLETSASLKRQYEVLTASRAEDAETMLGAQRVDLLLTDLRLPGKDGIALLESVKTTYPDLPVVLMSGHGTIEEAVRAIQLGAVDFVEKPFGPERLQVTVERALELKALQRENERLRTLAGAADEMVGKSRALEQVRAEIAKVAKSEAKVLVTGESGSGKELVARAIHRLSRGRADRSEAELRRAPRGPGRERALRIREGRLHRRREIEARAASSGRPGHPLPGRGGRHEPRHAEEAPAGDRRRARSSGVGGEGRSGRHADRRRHEQGPARRSGRGRFREDLYYRLNGRADPPAAAPRAARGHRAPRGALRRPPRRRARARAADRLSRGARAPHGLLLAGQRAGAQEPDRAAPHHDRR